jgi:deoxyribodipyrimidine photo-lyase
MTKIFENGLFIFRRDLRVIDNNGLNLLNEKCKNIFAIFIFTPEQVGDNNKYKSDNSVEFMIESLKNLSEYISKFNGQLYTFYGHNEKIIEECIKVFKIEIVCFNLDITPYAKERDSKIIHLCEHLKTYVMYDYDYYLNQPGTIVNGSGQPYQKFSPFYETCLKKKVAAPVGSRKIHFAKSSVNLTNKITLEQALKKFTSVNPEILVHGGRDNAIKQMHAAAKNIKNYSKTHNDLDKPTSELSAFIKFGCVSIREVYKAFHTKRDFIRQLYWRDFYANILYSFPYVLGYALKPKYNKIKWHHNDKWYQAWKNGTTGFPVVDAGMRQLNTTGFCHNRSRLIVMSFLIKILLIDWKLGEKYFANKLTDYDVASNNGNIQWVMGGGADSQMYNRIFNPWLQAENFDPDCIYIKKWIPELREVPVKDILHWDTEWVNYKNIGYNQPICNYQKQKEIVLKMYKAALY